MSDLDGNPEVSFSYDVAQMMTVWEGVIRIVTQTMAELYTNRGPTALCHYLKSYHKSIKLFTSALIHVLSETML